MPGKTNLAADAASRYPASNYNVNSLNVEDQRETLLIASITTDVQRSFSITWEKIIEETQCDPILCEILKTIENGGNWRGPGLSNYYRYRDTLYVCEGVILYKDRVVIPTSLRPVILNNLHAAQQRISAMESLAQSIVFWPRIIIIEMTRYRCMICNKHAPSRPSLPSEPADPQFTPF